ncbi:MAG: chemoreceptor glutamine deamidase CheD [Marinagarivorans sp.]
MSTQVLPKPLTGFEHVQRNWDGHWQCPAAKILPGECYVSNQDEVIHTVLGSCISVCIRDRRLGVGGMNHFMLPVQEGEKGITRQNSINPALCYGNWAMEFLINAILKQGGKREYFEIKMFGGGRVLTGMTNIDIGARNIEFAREYLRQEKFALAAEDVGDICPRKIIYFPKTGAVKLRRLVHTANDTIERRERDYLLSMNKKPAITDVELF